MNRVLSVFTELDSVYDSRRGILQWLMTEGIADENQRKAKGDKDWELHVQKNYENRRMDTFEYPAFKITKQSFERAYAERSISHWLMYYPSNLLKRLVKVIIDLEGLVDKPIDIKGVDLFVNIFPYALDQELQDKFVAYAQHALGNIVKVKVLNVDTRKADSTFYKQFSYVFKYDFLLSEHSGPTMDTLKSSPIPETTFVVPDILVKEVEGLQGSISDRIFAMSVLLAPSLRLVPISHQFYDARA